MRAILDLGKAIAINSLVIERFDETQSLPKSVAATIISWEFPVAEKTERQKGEGESWGGRDARDLSHNSWGSCQEPG